MKDFLHLHSAVLYLNDTILYVRDHEVTNGLQSLGICKKRKRRARTISMTVGDKTPVASDVLTKLGSSYASERATLPSIDSSLSIEMGPRQLSIAHVE